MSNQAEKYTKRRLRSSYLSVVVSMSLVLFMLGLLGLVVLNAKKVSDHVKENFAFTIILNENANETSIRQFQKSLEIKEYVKGTEFIPKEEAAKELQELLDEDFVEFLGANPLSDAIEVHFNADFANSDQLEKVEQQLSKEDVVAEVMYDKPLIQLMNDNIQKIGIALLALTGLLTLIAFALINSSIRLVIYSKRFIIKTMQLVGATTGFIRRPFVWRSIKQGFVASLLSLALLYGALYYLDKNMPELQTLNDYVLIGYLFGAVIILGVWISWICTFFAVRKYLRLKTDQLYY
jgi:cell division transport system permease protein